MDNTPMSPRSPEHDEWFTQLAASRTRVLAQARAGTVDTIALRQVADMEAELTLTLHPVPTDVAAHTRAAHAFARPYLERLLKHDPTHDVLATDAEHRYTPRKILRRVLDHALDHLNQLEQWLAWQQQGIVPVPTDGWADSATTLEEDRLPLTQADLNTWLWRIDLAVELVAQRAEQLSCQQLDWIAPGGGWSLRHMLHHLASGEIYYVVWLDEALPEEPVSRYDMASQRFGEQVYRAFALPGSENTFFFDGVTMVKAEYVIQEALTAERTLLRA
ncbi:MAG: hypothetical protein M3Z08_14995 [Chloroflexota bacterium]|nr:hypothetical protein [Chloroflexota bacterium]